MRLLVDTNVVIDIIRKRQPFFETSVIAIEKAIQNRDQLLFSSSSVTDVFYIVRKYTKSKEIAMEGIKQLITIFDFCTVDANCIYQSVLSNISDYEDAIVEAVGIHSQVDYIITRNVKDFENSLIDAITPQQYIDLKV